MSQEKEFQSNQVLNEFNKLFKQSFPNTVHPRQKADLMAFFMAGYQASCIDTRKVISSVGTEPGLLFMEEIEKDNFDRVQYLIQCMMREDYSHSMFK